MTKTRQRLIEMARELFARNGLEGTTMNDIAKASGRGRRTLYTYFRHKEEIYYAVIEEELALLSEKLKAVQTMHAEPEEKIFALVYTHLSIIRETVLRNGSLRAEFFRNIWMVEKVRRTFDAHEHRILRAVLQEGIDKGRFRIEDVGLMTDIIHYSVKGLEVPFIYGRIGHGLTEESSKPLVAKVVYGALGKKLNN